MPRIAGTLAAEVMGEHRGREIGEPYTLGRSAPEGNVMKPTPGDAPFHAKSWSATAENADAQVVEQLLVAGSDTDKPHPVEFFLYFPTKAIAEEAAALIGDAYRVTVEPGALDSAWLVFAVRSLIPTVAALTAVRAEFESLADRFGGEYDGWGSPVID